ncbi:hypothetical protein F5888DRAFT_1736754 [Russula emetica]|nr:hypothetical protein F5888DRAFT_1736754 [Russula emetica]
MDDGSNPSFKRGFFACQMLHLATPLASLSLFSGFVAAGIYAPGCSTSWRWSYNSLGQNACTVAAHLMSTCNEGSFSIEALAPGNHYTGPSDYEDTDLCKCNTVTYSLLSACVACQGEEWISWPKYMHNCTKVLPSSSFPNPVPSGTRVPYWALIDVTIKDTWDALQAYTIGGTPEAGPGTLLGHPIRFIQTSKDLPPGAAPKWTDSGVPLTTSPTNTSTRGSSLNARSIAGVFVGRVAAFSIICAAIFYLRRRRPRAQSPASMGDDVHHPQMEAWKSPSDRAAADSSSLIETLTTMTKPYKSKSSGHSDYV